MKNLFKVLGIIALVAIVGFSMTACGDDGDPGGGGGGDPGGGGGTDPNAWLVGSWESTDGQITFTLAADGGAWTMTYPTNNTHNGSSWTTGTFSGAATFPTLVLKNNNGTTWLDVAYTKNSNTKLTFEGGAGGAAMFHGVVCEKQP